MRVFLNTRKVSNFEASILLLKCIRHITEDLKGLMSSADWARELASQSGANRPSSIRIFSEQLKYQFITLRRALDLEQILAAED